MIVKPLGDAETEKFGGGGPAMVSERLSKVAVAKDEGVRLLTASPMYPLDAMLTV